jgi:hypothetical protein
MFRCGTTCARPTDIGEVKQNGQGLGVQARFPQRYAASWPLPERTGGWHGDSFPNDRAQRRRAADSATLGIGNGHGVLDE